MPLKKPSQELIETIGLEAAALLAERFGGLRLYVPVAPLVDHPIVATIGLDAAAQLSRRFGGGQILVPLRPARLWRIVELARRGETPREIALAMRCTERHVVNLLRR